MRVSVCWEKLILARTADMHLVKVLLKLFCARLSHFFMSFVPIFSVVWLGTHRQILRSLISIPSRTCYQRFPLNKKFIRFKVFEHCIAFICYYLWIILFHLSFAFACLYTASLIPLWTGRNKFLKKRRGLIRGEHNVR